MSTAPQEQHYENLPELTKDARNWAMICHLAGLLGFGLPLVGHLVGPFIIWMLKRDDHPFIDDQGKEALNFQLSMAIYMLVLGCTIIGIPVAIIFWIADVVLVIMAAVKAGDGEAYRYPMTIRFVK